MTEPFRVVCADPPWSFNDHLPGETRGAAKQYDCLSTQFICQLADATLGGLTIMEQPIATDAVLFLWRVAAMQRDALDVADAWGFRVKTEVVWLKKTVAGGRWFGMGHITRAEHEVCLVGTRGSLPVVNRSTRSTFVTDLQAAHFEGLSAKVGRHSEKPEEFYKIVEALYPGPYLELFARRQRARWTCIGNEVEKEELT